MSDHCKNLCSSGASCGAAAPVPLDTRLNPWSWSLACAALAMLGYGAFHTVPVRTIDADSLVEVLEFFPYEEISDWQLTIDATFTGVTRRNHANYSNYDRAAPPQKRACPT